MCRYGLAWCTSDASPLSGTESQYMQYPYEQRGVYFDTFEVQPHVGSPLPPARHRCVAMMADAEMD